MIEQTAVRTVPPGWYPDPAGSAALRWWDGYNWSGNLAPLPQRRPVPYVAPKKREPRKWLGRFGGFIVLGAFIVMWLYMLIVPVTLMHSRSLLVITFVLGGFAVASSFLYTMCYRLKPQDGLTAPFLALTFLIGGFASIVFPLIVEPLVALWTTELWPKFPSLISLLSAGPIEEFAKIAIVILVGRKVAVKTARNGLLIGGAVGFGFSAFENLGYGMTAAIAPVFPGQSQTWSIVTEVLIREITGPLAHPAWTAIIAAAVFVAWQKKRFPVTWKVVGVYLAVAAVHSGWDASGVLLLGLTGSRVVSGLLVLLIFLILMAATATVWAVIAHRAKRSNLARFADHEALLI